MFRPHNETEQDLQYEEAARAVCEKAFHCELTKLSPMLYGVDWCFHADGSVLGFGEYKRRNRHYETMMLSAAKWHRMVRLMNDTGLPVWLVFGFNDGIFWRKYSDQNPYVQPELSFAGSDRGQPGDKEPVVLLPFREFKRVSDEILL